MRRFVFFLYAKQPHYDSFAMVPVQGMSGLERDFENKIEAYFTAHVKSTYPNVYCEVRKVPIIADLAINMEKSEIIKTYNEKGRQKWTKRNLLNQF